jgi:hypothetical protein
MTNADYITNKASAWNYVSTSLFPAKELLLFLLDPFEIYWVNTNTHELNLISLDARADGYCIGAP